MRGEQRIGLVVIAGTEHRDRMIELRKDLSQRGLDQRMIVDDEDLLHAHSPGMFVTVRKHAGARNLPELAGRHHRAGPFHRPSG